MFTGVDLERMYKVTQNLPCLQFRNPNSKSPESKSDDEDHTIPPDRRHGFLARSLWWFKGLTRRLGQKVGSGECCFYSSEKYVQEQAQRCGLKAGKDFFFKTEEHVCLR